MPLQQAYGMSTYSIGPNISIYNNNLVNAFSNSYTLRVYNLDKIVVPVNIAYMCYGCYSLNHNLKLPPYITDAANAFSRCGNLSMPVTLINQNINNAAYMFGGCYNLNNNIILQNCQINNGYGMFAYAVAHSNEIILNNVIINNAYTFMAYMYNCQGQTSKHFEINAKVNNAAEMFAQWRSNYNEPIYIDNSNFYIESANNIFTSPYQLQSMFGWCEDWYLRNTNFYIGNGNYSDYSMFSFCNFGWADNCNFTIGDGHAMSYPYHFRGSNTGGTVRNCNFNFGNNWSYYGESFWLTTLIDNCNFNFGNNYKYIYKVFDLYRNLTLVNLNVNFGDNYNRFDWGVIDANYVIDCNFNLGNNYNNVYSSFDAHHFINCNFILGDDIKYIYYLFSGNQNLIGDFYFKAGNNIGELHALTDGWSINNTTLNSFSVILGNNINNLYYPIQFEVYNGGIKKANIIIGNNINKIDCLIGTRSYDYDYYSCSNFNISIGHNINNIYGAIRNLGNNSKIFIGNNINYLGDFLSLGYNAYHNQDYSLNNINTIEYAFLSLNNNSLYKGNLYFSNVNYVGCLVRSYYNNNYFNSNIYLNDVNTINQLMYNVNWIDGALYLNNVNHINGLLSGVSNFNQNIILPNTLQTFSQAFVSCPNFNQDITIPYNVTTMYRTFVGCKNFKNKNINILSPNVSNMQNMIINLIPNGYYQDDSYYNDYSGLRIYVPKDSLTNSTAHNTLSFNSTWTYNNSNNCYYHNNLFVYYI